MTERTQRRAAERKSRKAQEKRSRNQAQKLAAEASINAAPTPSAVPLKTFVEPAQSASPSTAEPESRNPVSEAQLAANRANAKFSSGPITEQGKSTSAHNNFRHGLTLTDGEPILIESESPAEYAQFLAAYQNEWQPATPTESDLVNRLVTHSWLRRRALGLQRLFLRPSDGLIIDEKQFNLYRRYEVQHERAFNKALSDLMRLRSLRLREQNGFESQRRKDEKHDYQVRQLRHREKMQKIAELTAEARLTLAEGRLSRIKPASALASAPSIPLEDSIHQQNPELVG